MKLLNDSGPAKFMYSVILVSILIWVVCFYNYYGGNTDSKVVLITGIVFFTIMYHFWVRIIMGNVSKLFKKHIHYKQPWFKERKFEKKLYKILRVKSWKDKALTYNPEQFSLKDNSLETIANTMAKSEVDHWINEVISLTTILFAIPWNFLFWAFLISAIVAMVFDSQFIIIQRYSRPRIVKILERETKKGKEEKKEKEVVEEV